MTEIILTSAISFVGTNIDDLFVLMLLYSHTTSEKQKIKISAGHFTGIFVLVLLSVLGAIGLRVVPYQFIRYLGIIPILLGIRETFSKTRENEKSSDTGTGIISTALITLANGGDNIGVYIPFFTGLTADKMILSVTVFTVLSVIWCWIAINLSELNLLRFWLKKYKGIIIPVVYILIGCMILFR